MTRPTTLNDFAGQAHIKGPLETMVKAAKAKGTPVGHMIMSGPAGLGKTTLSKIIASQMGVQQHEFFGGNAQKKDIVGALSCVDEGDILFIDEIHDLSQSAQEALYTALEDWTVEVSRQGGPVQASIPKFTLVGATTHEGYLTKPLTTRCQKIFEFEYYDEDSLSEIVINYIGNHDDLYGTPSDKTARTIASAARGIPRNAENLSKLVSDYWLVHVADDMNIGTIHPRTARKALVRDGICPDTGLTRRDRRYMDAIRQVGGDGIGIEQMSRILDLEKTTIENKIEPYLTRKMWVKSTNKGRVLTDDGTEALNQAEDNLA